MHARIYNSEACAKTGGTICTCKFTLHTEAPYSCLALLAQALVCTIAANKKSLTLSQLVHKEQADLPRFLRTTLSTRRRGVHLETRQGYSQFPSTTH